MSAEAVVPWLRLWAPELAAGTLAMGGSGYVLRPAQVVPWTTVGNVDVWRHGLIWPPLWTIVGVLLLAVTMVAGVTVADVVGCQTWRRRRMLRWRWESSTLGRGSRLRRIRIGDGVASATCSIRDGNWDGLKDRLDPDKGSGLRELRLDGKAWGSPIRAQFSKAGYRNPARSQRITLYFRPLPDAWTLPIYEEAALGSKLMMCYTADGQHFVDIDDSPHIEIVGPSGTGKGFALRTLEIQALRAGMLVMLIDGGKSPEHAALDGAATALRPIRYGMTSEQKLEASIAALEKVVTLAELRDQLCELFKVSRWVDLPAPVKAWQPRVMVFVDEVTALLAPSKQKDLDNLRGEIRRLLDVEGMRNGRKFGIHVAICDQFAYSGVFSKAAAMQAETRIVLGNLAPEHVKQATGLAGLPSVPEGMKLAGHVVAFGRPDSVREMRVPPNGVDELARAVAYVRGESS
jgi:hypothetical protein